MSSYTDKVITFERELLDGYPDPGDLVWLSLSPGFAGNIAEQDYETLIACAYSLGKFIVHIQYLGNKYQAQVTHLKRKIEFAKAKTIGELEFKAKDTDRTKLTAAYKKNPKLLEMEEEMLEVEQKAKYYDRIPDHLRELVNVLKYELRRKEQLREQGKLNAPV